MAKLNKRNEAHKDDLLEEIDETDQQSETPDIRDSVRDETVAEPEVPKEGKFAALKRLLRSKQFRIGAPVALIILVAVCVFVEPVKFALLNVVSSGQAKFVVVDDSTLAPVNDAKITIGGQTFKTDKNGKVTAKNLNFGKNTYSIEKETYDTKKAAVTVKTGTNLVGPLKVHSNGVPVEVRAINKLSGEAITDFTVSVKGTKISVRSDKKGTAILKVPSDKLGKQDIVVNAASFNEAVQEFNIAQGGRQNATSLAVTPTGKHYFLSNRDGKVSVYSANLDGSEQTLVIEGSAADDGTTTLSIAPDGKHAALVSKREGIKGPSGSVIPALYSVDLESKTLKRIDEGAPTFTVSGWVDNNKIVYSVNYDDYDRADNSKVKTADVTSGKLNTITSSSGYMSYYFWKEDPTHIYTFPSDTSKPEYGVYSIDLNNKNKQRLHPTGGYSIRHIKPYAFLFQDNENKWYEVSTKSQKVQPSQPSERADYQYLMSNDGAALAWTESRDGMSVLITGNADGGNAKQVSVQAKGVDVAELKSWVNNRYVIARTIGAEKNGDCIIDTKTGTITKIADVYMPNYYH